MGQIVLFFILVLSACSTQEDESKTILKITQEAVEAFNSEDASTLANLWEEDASYLDLKTGAHLKGRQAIEEALTQLFEEHEDMFLDLQVQSVYLNNPTTAIENGTLTLTYEEKIITKPYKALFEKKKGKWQLTEFSDDEKDLLHSNYEKLKGLEWLVGDFTDVDETSETKTKSRWDKNKNFITQHFTITTLDKEVFEGEQIIGYDPAKETIRSWTFDTDGGIGESTWKQEGDTWKVETTFTLGDGRRGSATHIFSKITPHSYTWQAINRQVNGVTLPDIAPLQVKRL